MSARPCLMSGLRARAQTESGKQRWPATASSRTSCIARARRTRSARRCSQALPRDHRRGQGPGLPDPDANPRLRAAVLAARAQSWDNIQRDRQGERRRRRELRGDPLRRVRPRRFAGGRGADRQPQPHRDQRAHHLLQERRQSRRLGLGHARLSAARPDRLPGLGRLRRRGARRGGRRRGRRSDEDGHQVWTAQDDLHGVARALEAALGPAASVGLAWRCTRTPSRSPPTPPSSWCGWSRRSRRMTTSRPSGAITKCPKR